jgi:hypothetical protein
MTAWQLIAAFTAHLLIGLLGVYVVYAGIENHPPLGIVAGLVYAHLVVGADLFLAITQFNWGWLAAGAAASGAGLGLLIGIIGLEPETEPAPEPSDT